MITKTSFYKRSFNKIIQRFNKDWSAIDWYFFEVGIDNYAIKQIQITYEGKVFKYDEINIEDENGGLAEGPLIIGEYIEITKEEFYTIWNKQFSNNYLVKTLRFDKNWKFSWYNIDYNKSEQELYDGGLILCGTYKERYLFDVEYLKPDDFLRFQIKKGVKNVNYSTCDGWDELVSTAQIWIDKIENNSI